MIGQEVLIINIFFIDFVNHGYECFKHGDYMELLLGGKLNEYLHEVDEECYEMQERLVEQMKEKQGVTEQLKAENQMLWVGKMNNIIACAEEIVVREVVYV